MTITYPSDQQIALQLAQEKKALLWKYEVLSYNRNSSWRKLIARCQRTVFWRTFWVWMVWIWRHTLGKWIYIKVTQPHRNPQAEVAAIRFVGKHTKIPVPRVWLHFELLDDYYILMSRIQGVPLEDVSSHLPVETLEVIFSQLRQYLSQLRAIPSPPRPNISSILGGSVQCYRLHDYEPSGPFTDEQQLNLQVRHGRAAESCPNIVTSSHARTHRLAFTHNDLFPRNIMVDERNVTAIIDWESAGWFPTHWEYCKSMNWGAWNLDHKIWSQWVPKFIPVFAEEANADKWLLAEWGVPTEHAV